MFIFPADPFYSIDIALNQHEEPRIVELGDGQVSDLTGDWTPEIFSKVVEEGFNGYV